MSFPLSLPFVESGLEAKKYMAKVACLVEKGFVLQIKEPLLRGWDTITLPP